MKDQHYVSILAHNTQAIELKVISLFKRRGYSINSLTVGKEKDLVRFTVRTEADKDLINQIEKQTYKMVDTIDVEILNSNSVIEREIALIKIENNNILKTDVLKLAGVFKGEIIEINKNHIIFEVIGSSEKIDKFISIFNEYNVLEVVRSGCLAMNRTKSININSSDDVKDDLDRAKEYNINMKEPQLVK